MSTGAPKTYPLDPEVQKELNKDKTLLRIQNEMYLRRHPEIKHIVNFFVHEVLKRQPDDVTEFAATLLSNDNLKQHVETFNTELLKYKETQGDIP